MFAERKAAQCPKRVATGQLFGFVVPTKGQQTFVGRIDKIWARICAISRSLRRRILCFCDALGVVQHFLVHVFLSLQYHQICD